MTDIEDSLKDAPLLLSPTQVAEIYNVGVHTVTRWADEGRLKVVRTPGGQRRFPKEDILRSLKDGYSTLTEPSDKRFL
jgi:excisionase family DNA binding protein